MRAVEPVRRALPPSRFADRQFINSDLFARYQTGPVRAIDEWTLMNNLDALGIKESTMRTHYETFIVCDPQCNEADRGQTEQDFAEMAGAGLNWVRGSQSDLP